MNIATAKKHFWQTKCSLVQVVFHIMDLAVFLPDALTNATLLFILRLRLKTSETMHLFVHPRVAPG